MIAAFLFAIAFVLCGIGLEIKELTKVLKEKLK